MKFHATLHTTSFVLVSSGGGGNQHVETVETIDVHAASHPRVFGLIIAMDANSPVGDFTPLAACTQFLKVFPEIQQYSIVASNAVGITRCVHFLGFVSLGHIVIASGDFTAVITVGLLPILKM